MNIVSHYNLLHKINGIMSKAVSNTIMIGLLFTTKLHACLELTWINLNCYGLHLHDPGIRWYNIICTHPTTYQNMTSTSKMKLTFCGSLNELFWRLLNYSSIVPKYREIDDCLKTLSMTGFVSDFANGNTKSSKIGFRYWSCWTTQETWHCDMSGEWNGHLLK